MNSSESGSDVATCPACLFPLGWGGHEPCGALTTESATNSEIEPPPEILAGVERAIAWGRAAQEICERFHEIGVFETDLGRDLSDDEFVIACIEIVDAATRVRAAGRSLLEDLNQGKGRLAASAVSVIDGWAPRLEDARFFATKWARERLAHAGASS